MRIREHPKLLKDFKISWIDRIQMIIPDNIVLCHKGSAIQSFHERPWNSVQIKTMTNITESLEQTRP